MPIYSPDIQLSENDVKIIRELSLLLVNSSELEISKEVVLEGASVLMSQEQAITLLKYLRNKLNKFKFKQQIRFSQMVFQKKNENENEAKQIYAFLNSKRLKKSLGVNYNFDVFQARLKKPLHWHHAISTPPTVMTYDHFIKMERKLFEELQIHPSVRTLILDLLETQRTLIDNSRAGDESNFNDARILPFLEKIISQLSIGTKQRSYKLALSSLNVSSLIGILSNTGILVTTRDWGVTGAISTMASFSFSITK